MRSLYFFLFILLSVGCNNRDPILGQWERYGDDAEGTVVQVERAGNWRHARLIKVAGVLKELGFAEDDIKWRDIEPMGNNRWRGKDLIKEIDSTGTIVKTEYIDVYYTLIDENILEVRWFASDKWTIGSLQRWRRITPVSR